MIKPPDIDNTVWEVISAAASGDLPKMRELLAEDPQRSREGYWYTPPIHYAVREGHLEVVQLLLDAGADAEWNAYYGSGLIDMAKERGHDAIARLLEKTRDRRGRAAAAEDREDHPIHLAAQEGDVRRVRALLDADPSLLNRGDRAGGTPLHRAVEASARDVVELLLDRGANIDAVHGTSRGAGSGYWPYDVQAIDIAIWGGLGRRRRPPMWRLAVAWARYWLWRRFRKPCPQPCDVAMARFLISRGAAHDLTVASALGDFDRVKAILEKDPAQVREARPSGRRPLTVAVEFGHDDIVRYLLDRGADPSLPEASAEKGAALHIASSRGNRDLVELLLKHGADPNGHNNAGGNSMFAAKTEEIRTLLVAYGGTIDPYDLVWKDEDDEVIRRVTEDPKSAELGCGGVFTAVVTREKRDLLKRLLDAGIRVPPVVTGCQSYLLEQPDMLQTLLNYGMNPDTCNWQHQTLLHLLCREDPEGKAGKINTLRAQMLLDAGANISAREEEYSSTPLGWAARHHNLPMVEFLLSRGAPTNLPGDKAWATPLAWARSRGHKTIEAVLRKAGATN